VQQIVEFENSCGRRVGEAVGECTKLYLLCILYRVGIKEGLKTRGINIENVALHQISYKHICSVGIFE
jgi:hypothetical protein